MKTELVEVSPTQREIKIEIEPEAVKEVYNKVSQKYAKSAQVPGFRKGYAPVDVVRLRYKNEIRQDVLQDLLPKFVTQAIQEHELNPLAEPQLHLDNAENVKLNGSEPVNLHIHVEIMPEIPTPEYKGLEVTRRVRPTDESDVENIIDERRKQFASLVPVEDRAAEEGDTLVVDLEGTFSDDSNAEPIKADGVEITLGDANIEKSFTENLAGLKEDDTKEFTVEYPSDFTSPALAGKTVHYKAEIKSVGKIELPEADDEWVQSLDEGFDSVKDLRDKLRTDLEQMAFTESDNQVRNQLIAQLIKNHDFEVPNALIDMQARNLLNNFGQDLAERGVDLSKVEKDFIEMAYQQMRTQAERDVRGAMLLEKVAELENVEVTSDDIAKEIESMASYYQATPEQIRASLSQQEGGEANIANSLRTRKAVEALVQNAKISDGEWIDENQPNVEVSAGDETGKEEKSEKKSSKTKEKKAKAEKSEKAVEDKPKKETKKKTAKKEK